MDVTALLGWLAIAVALNSAVTAVLAVLIVRSRPVPERAEGSRRLTVPQGAPLSKGASTEGSDPLAGAIDAFLGRSDGLFRAGGPPINQPAVSPGPPSRPAMAPTDERLLPEVASARSRPSRFVPSGPHPVEDRGAGEHRLDTTTAGSPPGAFAIGPPGRSVSRVSIALSDRGGSGAAADAAAVARLGPVIGGFIRERTRADDRVSRLPGGRYNIVLPDTSLDGASALVQRLVQSCDAWLAAEQPPLRLEFGVVDLPPDALAASPAMVRAGGPERRRAVPQDA